MEITSEVIASETQKFLASGKRIGRQAERFERRRQPREDREHRAAKPPRLVKARGIHEWDSL